MTSVFAFFKRSIKSFLRERGYTLARTVDLPHLVRMQGYTVSNTNKFVSGVNVYHDTQKLAGAKLFQTIFDIGANVGQTTFKLVEHFPNSRIFAFEPVSETFKELEKKYARATQCNRSAICLWNGTRSRNHHIASQFRMEFASPCIESFTYCPCPT